MLVRTDALQKAAVAEPVVAPLVQVLERGPVMQSGALSIFADNLPVLAAGTSVTIDNGKLEGSWIKVSGTGPEVLTFNREDDTVVLMDGRGRATNFDTKNAADTRLETTTSYRHPRKTLPTQADTKVTYVVSGDTLVHRTEYKENRRSWVVFGAFNQPAGNTESENVYVRHDPAKPSFPELRDQTVKSTGDAVVDKLQSLHAGKERSASLRKQIDASVEAYKTALAGRQSDRIAKVLKGARVEALLKAVEYECPALRGANTYGKPGLVIDLGLVLLGDGRDLTVFLGKGHEGKPRLLAGDTVEAAPVGYSEQSINADALRNAIDTLTEGLADGAVSAERLGQSVKIVEKLSKTKAG